MTIHDEAKKMADEFLLSQSDYQMGYLSAEQSNSKTKNLDLIFKADVKNGIKTLLSVDEELTDLYSSVIMSDSFDKFTESIYKSLSSGHKIILSGCGSSGRLCMRCEKSMRDAAQKDNRLQKYADNVISLMTGGDYALIRAVESFEDFAVLGAKQADELGVGEGDLLIGVTATGETTSILGTAQRASERGADVYMLICQNPELIIDKMERTRNLYTRDNVYSLWLDCPPMAITGSTRMQSSTIEQAVLLTGFEAACKKILGEEFNKEYYISAYKDMMKQIASEDFVSAMAEYADTENKLYRDGGYVTYFTKDYILDILTDTTERAPTFATPPLRPQKNTDEPLSWAFVKTPYLDTISAWEYCFSRKPRCISWGREDYSIVDIKTIPDISYDRMMEFEIGNERDIQRESADCNMAVWIDTFTPGDKFKNAAANYKSSYEIILPAVKSSTLFDIFEHILSKLAINIISTSAMVIFGRVSGNYMTYVDMSNKKLMDRGARIISDVCNVSYEKALYELFYAYLELKSEGAYGSPVQAAIKKLRQ